MPEVDQRPADGDDEHEDDIEAEDENEPDPAEGFTLVEARYEYTPWGDDHWLIAGFDRSDGTFGIYDFMLEAWLEIVPAEEQGQACQRVLDDWLDNNFRVASILTALELDGLSRPDIRRLMTRRVAFEEAQIDGAVESAPSANPYQERDIVAEWEITVVLDPASPVPLLSADQVTRFFADEAADRAGASFETWIERATPRWRDNGELLTREEAGALLRLCRYIAACCK